MSIEWDVDTATEAAWRGFRGRLADHLADMDEAAVLRMDCEWAGEEADAPFIEIEDIGDGRLALLAGGSSLHDPVSALRMQELTWCPPGKGADDEHFFTTGLRREADRLAVLTVRTLRELQCVAHPCFLQADGLEQDPGAARPVASSDDVGVENHDEYAVLWPSDPAQLQDIVDTTMREVFPDLEHDSDGDIPIVSGRSVVYIRVLTDRATVRLFSPLVHDVSDTEQVLVEVALLNDLHPLYKFVVHDDTVVMSHEIPALPFVPYLLRTTAARFSGDMDDIARALTVHIGGHRAFETTDDNDEMPSDVEVAPASIDGLLELMHLGRPRPSTVAGLFDHNRLEIIEQLVRIRTGGQTCGDHELECVLDALRRALRLVSDGNEPRARKAVPPGPPSPFKRRC